LVAQANLQILWLLKNKDLSHWIILYTDNTEEQLQGVQAKIECLGQLKIKTSFMKNKFFAKNEVSQLHDSPGKTKESDMPESEMMEYNQDYSRSTSMVDSRCHSILDRSALR